MPLQVPPLLRQLLRPQQYSRRHRSRLSFNSSALLLHKRLLPRVLLLLLLIYQQQQQAPTWQPPHRLTSSGSTLLRSVAVSPPKHDPWVFGGYHTRCFITHPHLSHPQTHPVGVRTCYHTPWFITPPHLSHTQTYPVGGRTCYHTPWFITPPGGRRDQHSITGATQDTTLPTVYHTPVIIFSSAQIYHRGCVI